MPYIIDIAYPLEEREGRQGLDQAIDEVMDLPSPSSGAGFGLRDIQFEARTKRQANSAVARLIEFAEHNELELEYVGRHYQLPYWLWRLADKVGLAERYFN